ncbi:hypothetical protein QBC47DRAFT_387630 [Echria macrotheca]|uniref:Uncharacterized protein n=1 Tax=Echria macrotheca TaxID=438768 RepID=A0AAJ0B7C3_9PEZI|nr:hypothetical protein QBC47DRAFT_387630 [Echria macrotheca]
MSAYFCPSNSSRNSKRSTRSMDFHGSGNARPDNRRRVFSKSDPTNTVSALSTTTRRFSQTPVSEDFWETAYISPIVDDFTPTYNSTATGQPGPSVAPEEPTSLEEALWLALTRQWSRSTSSPTPNLSATNSTDSEKLEPSGLPVGYDGPLSTCSEESSARGSDWDQKEPPRSLGGLNRISKNTATSDPLSKAGRRRIPILSKYPKAETFPLEHHQTAEGQCTPEERRVSASSSGHEQKWLRHSLDLDSYSGLERTERESAAGGDDKSGDAQNPCDFATWRGSRRFLLRGKRPSRSKSVSSVLATSESLLLHGSERRWSNRESGAIFSDSTDPSSRPPCHLIAIAGMMLAAGELDRLSTRANDMFAARRRSGDHKAFISGGSTPSVLAVPTTTPKTWSGRSSVSQSVSPTPLAPPNSPASPEGSPRHHVRRHSERQWVSLARSRLSEVSTPAEALDDYQQPEEFDSFSEICDHTDLGAYQAEGGICAQGANCRAENLTAKSGGIALRSTRGEGNRSM